MTFVAPPDAVPSKPQSSEIYRPAAPTRFVAEERPSEYARPKFIYRRRFIPLDGGKLLLRLWDDPEVEVDPKTLECEVVGWGVRLHHRNIFDVDRQMARQFLNLFAKVDSNRLSEEETKIWLQIIDRVDFKSFCIDRAAPQYLEGTLVRKQPVWRVEWHDGEKTNIPPAVASPLRVLNEGDQFGAFVKLGLNNEVRLLERVLPILER